MQNTTGQLLLLGLSEVGQNIFEANINGKSFLRAQDEIWNVKCLILSAKLWITEADKLLEG